MSYLWFAFEMFVNLAYGILWCWFTVRYFGFKENIKSRYLITALFSLILFAVISALNYYIIYEGFLASIYVTVIFMFALIFLNGNLWEKILISILEQILLSGIAFIMMLSVGLLLDDEYIGMISMEFSIFRLVYIILVFTIYILMLKLILYLKKEFHEMKKSQWIIIILISLISLILIVSIVEIILTITTQKSYYPFLVVSITSIIILNILVYIFMGILNRNNKMILKYQLENQQRLFEEKNIDNIKNMYEKIRILKHDMKHHNDFIMSKLTDMLSTNNIQKDYISDIVSYISGVSKDIDMIKSNINTGNKAIDSLLNYKLGTAAEKNIKTETIIDKNISGISDIDLCRILGNLFDNAIEACENENIENKQIVFHMTTKNSCLLISMKNSIAESVISKNPNLDTIKEDKEIHGMGLKSIKSIVEKYSGMLKISETEDNFFMAEVLLNKDNYEQILI